ncbi:MAG: hypothetical protein Q8P59_06950, partial [Dehalococcoidia bacterium]|nr:hypothetical protein [Dehalococcoidia bacterium]
MMKPSAFDTFRLRDILQGRVQVLLLKSSPGKIFQKGGREFPDLEVDQEVVPDSQNAKAVNVGVLLASLFMAVPGRAITHLSVGAGPG